MARGTSNLWVDASHGLPEEGVQAGGELAEVLAFPIPKAAQGGAFSWLLGLLKTPVCDVRPNAWDFFPRLDLELDLRRQELSQALSVGGFNLITGSLGEFDKRESIFGISSSVNFLPDPSRRFAYPAVRFSTLRSFEILEGRDLRVSLGYLGVYHGAVFFYSPLALVPGRDLIGGLPLENGTEFPVDVFFREDSSV